MANVNWTDLQKAAGDAAFNPLPNDIYDVFVHEAEATQSQSGKDMIKVQFKVQNGPHQNRVVFNQFVISPDSPNALAFFFRHMAALGLDEAFFATNPPIEHVARTLVGRTCRVKLSTREWQGQDRNQVDAVLPPTAGTATVAPPAPTAMAPTPPAPGVPAGVGPSPMPVAPPVTPTPTAPTVPVPAAPPADELPF